jgi:peptidoglycan/LPS O-acetylase OafA/YrhL
VALGLNAGFWEYYAKSNIMMFVLDRFFQPTFYFLLIILLNYGYIEKFAKILSHKIMIPFNRMGFSIYISHAIILKWLIFPAKNSIILTLAFYMYNLLLGLVFTILFSTLLYVFVEKPAENLLIYLKIKKYF